MKPLFPLKSKKVGIIRDSDLLIIARKIDEVTKRAKSAEQTSSEVKLEKATSSETVQGDSTPAQTQPCEQEAS